MRRAACAMVVITFLTFAACSPRDETVTSGDVGTPTTETTPATVAADPARPGLWTDERCTRTIGAETPPMQVEFRAEDLQRMVFTRDDVGGLVGFETDIARHGYHGNGELQTIEVNPASTCEDLKDFGRITGYGTAYRTWSGQRVMFSVHLFWDDKGAHDWTTAFTSGIAATVGTPDGPSRFAVEPLPDLGSDAGLIEHVGTEGIREWAIFRRGPIVGWVVELHQGGGPTIDVIAAAGRMADRVDQVAQEAATRPRHGLDAAHLLSAPLPLDMYGERYQGLDWNYFFGGCSDTEERAAIAGEDEAEDARRFGRVVGCSAMYEPATGTAHDVVRIYSSVTVYRDGAGAAADLADMVAEVEGDGGQRFETAGLGDESVGFVNPGVGLTRIAFRIDGVIAVVQVHENTLRATPGELEALALELEARVDALMAHSAG